MQWHMITPCIHDITLHGYKRSKHCMLPNNCDTFVQSISGQVLVELNLNQTERKTKFGVLNHRFILRYVATTDCMSVSLSFYYMSPPKLFNNKGVSNGLWFVKQQRCFIKYYRSNIRQDYIITIIISKYTSSNLLYGLFVLLLGQFIIMCAMLWGVATIHQDLQPMANIHNAMHCNILRNSDQLNTIIIESSKIWIWRSGYKTWLNVTAGREIPSIFNLVYLVFV